MNADKIETNSKQLHKITAENQFLKNKNETLKSRMEALEQTQLTNNIILTGVQEGPFEPYSTTKLRVYEMIAATYATGNSENDLYEAQKVDITNCNRVGKFRHNYSRLISITFAKRDDKEIFLANKKRLPEGIYANEEYPLHIKRNRDRLRHILRLAKSIPHYANKCKLIQDRLVINGITYKVDDIPNLPLDLAAFKAAEKTNDTHLVFAGDLSPYSNFNYSPFEINSQQFHSAEQWIQYQKALMFGDSYTANRILLADTPIECKRLGYKINGVNREKWHSDGYEICFAGIREKFMQNQSLLQLLKSTTPKTIAEATTDKIWGTGITLRDSSALQTDKWHSPGWLSRMLMTIRDEH